MYEVIKKGRKHNLSISCQLDLFDKLVKSILLYGCEIWGSANNDILEKVHLKFCKIILHLKATTPNCMIYGELGRYPLDIDIKLIRNILNCILKWLYESMFESSVVKPNDKLNWACRVRDILFKYGFHNIWISQYVNHVDFFYM
jgi:hypothetical protein